MFEYICMLQYVTRVELNKNVETVQNFATGIRDTLGTLAEPTIKKGWSTNLR
jgi:hypothetical protein